MHLEFSFTDPYTGQTCSVYSTNTEFVVLSGEGVVLTIFAIDKDPLLEISEIFF